MKVTVHRKGAYYHATVEMRKDGGAFRGLHMITPFWDPFRALPSSPIDQYSGWTIRVYRWRMVDGTKTWATIKNEFSRLLDWAAASDLQYALEFSFQSRSFHVNCNWGASERRPGRKGLFDAREDDLEEMLKETARGIEAIWETLVNNTIE